jgi:hypothetical protein
LGERLLCKQEVSGSIPLTSTIRGETLIRIGINNELAGGECPVRRRSLTR